MIPNPPSSAGQLKDPLLLFTLKLSPFYLWFAIFTAQPHKEERFLFVVYPLICFNAVMTMFMAQKLVQRGLDRFVTRSKTAAIHKYSRGLVWVVLIVSAAVSVSRILALYEHYSAPIDVYRNAFDLVKVPEPIGSTSTVTVEGTEPTVMAASNVGSSLDAKKEIIRVCVGKEWYRFPSHYFLPEGARLGLIKSHFDGLLPGEFQEQSESGYPTSGKSQHPLAIDWRWSAERRPGTSHIPALMNNENKEVAEHYVSALLHAHFVLSDWTLILPYCHKIDPIGAVPLSGGSGLQWTARARETYSNLINSHRGDPRPGAKVLPEQGAVGEALLQEVPGYNGWRWSESVGPSLLDPRQDYAGIDKRTAQGLGRLLSCPP